MIEIGHIWLGATLRRTTAATEAMYLLARHAFDDLGYRRLEWKCNALNAASCRAAERLGFTFEGVVPSAHGRRRAATATRPGTRSPDGEWPAIRSGFEAWLAPENRDADGASAAVAGGADGGGARARLSALENARGPRRRRPLDEDSGGGTRTHNDSVNSRAFCH